MEGMVTHSMRRRVLYFATRSLRAGAPVLIWPVPRATTRSAMKVFSVSPLRWETMTPQPSDCESCALHHKQAVSTGYDIILMATYAWIDSETVPIWFTCRPRRRS